MTDRRTNIVLDMQLVREAQKLTGISTIRGVVHEALRALVDSRRRTNLTDLKGKIRFYPGFDVKEVRRGGRG